MNCRGWRTRLEAFFSRLEDLPGRIHVRMLIKAPIEKSELTEIAAKWPNGLPGALERFWRDESSGMDCFYWWEPPERLVADLKFALAGSRRLYGGPCFEAATVFPGNYGPDCEDLDIRRNVGDFGYRLLSEAAMLFQCGNGDYVGLLGSENDDDPPVVYCHHDGDGSGYIARSFTEFLVQWEQIFYVGPALDLMWHWMDSESGLISSDAPTTRRLQKLFERSFRPPGQRDI